MNAAVPDDIEFATKPALAQALMSDALTAGVPASWVTADEVYRGDSKLRHHLHKVGLGYVLAVAEHHQICTGIGTRRAIDLAVRLPRHTLPRHTWQRLSAGPGSEGQRWSGWALIDTTHTIGEACSEPVASESHWLLTRRNRSTSEYAFYRAYSPTLVPAQTLIRVAGRRCSIEESFAAGRELAALDERQIRTRTSLQTLDRPGDSDPRVPVRHGRH
jgi:SRSO17 transposase